ncbi:unnamed protein product [Rhizoctonia solani]|uniref:Rho termination factor N-terminal domain-containing protein n=1 Tax=Rhizoctonia solani TaxID=456999 RepID=A0A8H2WTN3_9AGAM|nr:unnamed protein product [Rhizoctonia solani]
MDHASLLKLNVAKLKEKCKELKIAGYSKLSKPLLIERLVAFGWSVGAKDGTSNVKLAKLQPLPEIADKPINYTPKYLTNNLGHVQTVAESSQQRLEECLPEKAAATTKRPRKNKDNKEPANKRTKKAKIDTIDNSYAPYIGDLPRATPSPLDDVRNEVENFRTNRAAMQECSPSPHLTRSHLAQLSNDLVHCMPPVCLPSTHTQAKKLEPTRPTPATAPRKSNNANPSRVGTPDAIRPRGPNCPRPSTIKTQNQVAQLQPQPISTAPLRNPQTYKPKAFKPLTILRPPRTNSPKPIPSSEIASTETSNFQAPDLCTSFPLISMPPSTARRRQAERMSVVFSGIIDCEVLGLCVGVSRAWRYAVYLSAVHALRRSFSGARLDSVFKQIKEPRMTNMWMYLRARRLEAQSRHETFRASWLGQFFECEGEILGLGRGFEPVSRKMWTSPDDDRQIIVALRFISTRVVFSLARRYNEYDQKWINPVDQVVGAEEIVPDEIWRITTSSVGGNLKSFHILYDTGEVIGLVPSPRQGITGQRVAKNRPHIEVLESESGGLRADWRAYINSCELDSRSSLQDSITSGNRESYVAGVSAFWLRSVSLEDDGLKTVARKYVLSCVEPNSLSGEYKTAIDMAGDVAGAASHVVNGKSRHQVGLYISE